VGDGALLAEGGLLVQRRLGEVPEYAVEVDQAVVGQAEATLEIA
jgi:hypothetical protein